MQEGQLVMTQADRDRLVALKKAKKKRITQREAAEEVGVSVRHVKRLLYALKKHGVK
jgi:DNA-binding Lrp family transcriptional regulator